MVIIIIKIYSVFKVLGTCLSTLHILFPSSRQLHEVNNFIPLLLEVLEK